MGVTVNVAVTLVTAAATPPLDKLISEGSVGKSVPARVIDSPKLKTGTYI